MSSTYSWSITWFHRLLFFGSCHSINIYSTITKTNLNLNVISKHYQTPFNKLNYCQSGMRVPLLPTTLGCWGTFKMLPIKIELNLGLSSRSKDGENIKTCTKQHVYPVIFFFAKRSAEMLNTWTEVLNALVDGFNNVHLWEFALFSVLNLTGVNYFWDKSSVRSGFFNKSVKILTPPTYSPTWVIQCISGRFCLLS